MSYFKKLSPNTASVSLPRTLQVSLSFTDWISSLRQLKLNYYIDSGCQTWGKTTPSGCAKSKVQSSLRTR